MEVLKQIGEKPMFHDVLGNPVFLHTFIHIIDKDHLGADIMTAKDFINYGMSTNRYWIFTRLVDMNEFRENGCQLITMEF